MPTIYIIQDTTSWKIPSNEVEEVVKKYFLTISDKVLVGLYIARYCTDADISRPYMVTYN